MTDKAVGRIVGDVDSRGKARVQTVNELPSETRQGDADEADINKIMGKFLRHGLTPNMELADNLFLDVTEFTDFKDAVDQLNEAERLFHTLPSKVRELFNHNVAEWLDAAHDPEKRDDIKTAAELLYSAHSVGSSVTASPSEGAEPGGGEAAGSGETSASGSARAEDGAGSPAP